MTCPTYKCSVSVLPTLTSSTAQTEDEISCRADERVAVIQDMGDGWLKVKKGDGSDGYIPESYAEYL